MLRRMEQLNLEISSWEEEKKRIDVIIKGLQDYKAGLAFLVK